MALFPILQSLPPGTIAFYLLLLVWSLIWKGIALWKSARLKHKAWFIVLLILNTIGILEILYIFVFSKCCDSACCKKEIKSNKNIKRRRR